MRTEAQISMHLLMAGTLSILGVLLSVITLLRPWELWMIPLIIIGCLVVWWLHIGRIGSELLYENICTGLLLIDFFYFGVHESSLYDIPLVACTALLLFSLLDRKQLLYLRHHRAQRKRSLKSLNTSCLEKKKSLIRAGEVVYLLLFQRT